MTTCLFSCVMCFIFSILPTSSGCRVSCCYPINCRSHLFSCSCVVTCDTATVSDPCQPGTTSIVLSDPRRDKETLSKTRTDFLCDAGLATGWYQFKDAGNSLTIPVTDCVDLYRCGTVVPIFIQDTSGQNPSEQDGVVTRTACGNYLSCCFFQYKVCVRNCGASGMFYYLQRPSGCSLAYCTGKHALESFFWMRSFSSVVIIIHVVLYTDRRRSSCLPNWTTSQHCYKSM